MPLKDWKWNRQNILAAVATVVTLWGLLDAVLYCDTSYRAAFGNNTRCTLFGLFISTFLSDLRDQIHSLFSKAPTGSLSGETTAGEWVQCLFVPFIVAWLIYWIWPRLREAPVRGSRYGYLLLIAGLVSYLLGYMANDYYIGVASLQLVYAGLIILFLGWKIMRMVLFPWAFLLFMWPYGFIEDIAFQLRMLMSSLSHTALSIIGVANSLNGSSIISPPGAQPVWAIDIADPCSGIRSLAATLMMGALAAFILFDRSWQKALIVLAAVPIVIFGNLIRIMMLTLATIHFGESFALGVNDHPSWFHEGAGYVVYLIDITGVIGFGMFLTWLSKKRKAT